MAPKELVVRMCHFALKLEKFQMFGDSINTLLGNCTATHRALYIRMESENKTMCVVPTD